MKTLSINQNMPCRIMRPQPSAGMDLQNGNLGAFRATVIKLVFIELPIGYEAATTKKRTGFQTE
jgi:hypothetical protein